MGLKVTAPPCPEDDCDGVLVLREAHDGGKFFGCSRWVQTQCPGSASATKKGKLWGTPTNQAGKAARIAAHDAFDRLWQYFGSEEDRSAARVRAYLWLAWVLHLTPPKCHIRYFDAAMCQRVIDLAGAITWRDLAPYDHERTHRLDPVGARNEEATDAPSSVPSG